MGNYRWMKRLMVLVVSGALMATLAATAVLAQQEVQGPVTVTGVIQKKDSELPLAPDTGLYFITDEETGVERDLLDCNDTVPIEDFEGQRVTVSGIPQTQGETPTGEEPLCVTAIESAGAQGRETSWDMEFIGTENSEVLFGTGLYDLIKGLGGHDYLNGMPGADILKGGRGHDLIVGEAGSDAIHGGPGNDYLVAAYGYWQQAPNAPASPDLIQGGGGHDLIDSADLAGAPDTVICGPGGDLVYAGVEDFVADDCEVVYRYFGF